MAHILRYYYAQLYHCRICRRSANRSCCRNRHRFCFHHHILRHPFCDHHRIRGRYFRCRRRRGRRYRHRDHIRRALPYPARMFLRVGFESLHRHTIRPPRSRYCYNRHRSRDFHHHTPRYTHADCWRKWQYREVPNLFVRQS